jgi:hypothetical protein
MDDPKLNPMEAEVLRQLESRQKSISPKDTRTRTPSGFVLQYGYWYEPVPTPVEIPTGKPNECFANAFWLAFNNPSLICVEGFALYGHNQIMTAHAWVTDGKGRAIDTTWDRVGVAYAGVPFKLDWLNKRYISQRAIVCILDDYMNDWPILRDLGDRPDEWIDRRGVGIERLSNSLT